MLRSRHFYSEYAYRQRIKSPVEFVLGMVRTIRPTASPRDLVSSLEEMGQPLFAPPNVKGWPGGKTWLNSATVLARQNFAQSMSSAPPPEMNSPQVFAPPGLAVPPPTAPAATDAPPAPSKGPGLSSDGIVGIIEQAKVVEPKSVVDLLADVLLQGDIDSETRKKLIAFFAEDKPEKARWQQRVRETAHALLTLPEFTLA
jgi:hypothetical protein